MLEDWALQDLQFLEIEKPEKKTEAFELGGKPGEYVVLEGGWVLLLKVHNEIVDVTYLKDNRGRGIGCSEVLLNRKVGERNRR